MSEAYISAYKSIISLSCNGEHLFDSNAMFYKSYQTKYVNPSKPIKLCFNLTLKASELFLARYCYDMYMYLVISIPNQFKVAQYIMNDYKLEAFGNYSCALNLTINDDYCRVFAFWRNFKDRNTCAREISFSREYIGVYGCGQERLRKPSIYRCLDLFAPIEVSIDNKKLALFEDIMRFMIPERFKNEWKVILRQVASQHQSAYNDRWSVIQPAIEFICKNYTWKGKIFIGGECAAFLIGRFEKFKKLDLYMNWKTKNSLKQLSSFDYAALEKLSIDIQMKSGAIMHNLKECSTFINIINPNQIYSAECLCDHIGKWSCDSGYSIQTAITLTSDYEQYSEISKMSQNKNLLSFLDYEKSCDQCKNYSTIDRNVFNQWIAYSLIPGSIACRRIETHFKNYAEKQINM